MIFYPILLFVFAFSFLFSATPKPFPSLITLLQHRESGILSQRPLEKTWLEKKIVTAELKNCVSLMDLEHPSNDQFIKILDIIPKRLRPHYKDSYEHNALMDIIPPAFKETPFIFKKDFIGWLHGYESDARTYYECKIEFPYWFLALIESGLDANIELSFAVGCRKKFRASSFIEKDHTGEYTKGLLARGMDLHQAPHCYRNNIFSCVNNLQVATVLVQAGAKVPYDILSDAWLYKFPAELIAFYAQQGVDINIQDEHLRTPLHDFLDVAVRDKTAFGTFPVEREPVEILLSLGAKLDIKNKNNKSIKDIVKQIMSKTADVFGEGKHDWLHEAINNQDYLQEAYRLRSVLLDQDDVRA